MTGPDALSFSIPAAGSRKYSWLVKSTRIVASVPAAGAGPHRRSATTGRRRPGAGPKTVCHGASAPLRRLRQDCASRRGLVAGDKHDRDRPATGYRHALGTTGNWTAGAAFFTSGLAEPPVPLLAEYFDTGGGAFDFDPEVPREHFEARLRLVSAGRHAASAVHAGARPPDAAGRSLQALRRALTGGLA